MTTRTKTNFSFHQKRSRSRRAWLLFLDLRRLKTSRRTHRRLRRNRPRKMQLHARRSKVQNSVRAYPSSVTVNVRVARVWAVFITRRASAVFNTRLVLPPRLRRRTCIFLRKILRSDLTAAMENTKSRMENAILHSRHVPKVFRRECQCLFRFRVFRRACQCRL